MSLCFPQKKKRKKISLPLKVILMLIFLSLKLRFDSPLFWRYCRGGRVFCSLVFLYKKKKRLWESWTHTTLNRSKIIQTPILRNEKLSSYTLPGMRTVVKTSGLFVTLFDLKTKYPDNFWKYENKDKWELGVNRKQECYNWTVESKHYLLPEDRKFFTPLLHITV